MNWTRDVAKGAKALDAEKGNSGMASAAHPVSTLSRLSQERHLAGLNKRGQYFVKGPLPFEWICINIPDPASRVTLVARAFMDMEHSDECALTAKIWQCAGVENRYQRRRVLRRLREVRGNYEIEDRKGRPSVMRKIRPPDTD